jgi:hypothetical protein
MRAKLGPQRRFHFYSATDGRKRWMLRQIAEWNLLACVYVRRGLFPPGQEGSRAECLRRLLLDLKSWGVTELSMESRGTFRDHRDEITILSALNVNRAPTGLTYSWSSGNGDCLLWMADAIASAQRASLAPGAPYSAELESLLAAARQVR